MEQNCDASPGDDAFGCECCCGATAEALWGNLRNFARPHILIDQSHLIVSIRVCPACGQRWLQVFTELMDFEKGDDSQAWCVAPITAEESDSLVRQGENLALPDAVALSEGRRYLRVVHPRGQERSVSWATGAMPLFPHS